MDRRTKFILRRIRIHFLIKKYITYFCYFLIFSGILIFIFYTFSANNHNYKLVSDYKKNPDKFTTEKIMQNPQIRFQYNDDEIYNIKAKRAINNNNTEATLFEVEADGKIGNITAGELKIDQAGDHLLFSQNPVLILTKGGL